MAQQTMQLSWLCLSHLWMTKTHHVPLATHLLLIGLMRYKMDNDLHSTLAVGIGGISAPLWLPALNEWVALILGLTSLAYVLVKLYKLTRK